GNPQHALKDKGIIDSGCSTHMTGNISYLSYFEEINKGYVAFGGNPKGGKITGKGKIRTGKLDFDGVYFVKELKFNLFSVSQMCDKKNSVLFTDTECIVLSSNFKLPDENYVLLRVPRENNMYNVDLKNIVPSGDLTCLFVKATLDESNLWHIRLGHINFKTMNKLVKGKFKGKVDEGFMVGYSVNSKSFRVFNSRTRIIQETLHVNFLENKLNLTGSGLIWLFDIDSLTRTMNYQPFNVGNQTNPSASFQDKFDAKKAREEGDQQYLLFPMWSSGSTNPQNNKEDATFGGKEHGFDAKKPKSEVILSLSNASQPLDDPDMPELEDITYFNDEDVVGGTQEDTSSSRRSKNKKDERGIVIKNKARLVVQGHTQEEGIDYKEVFAPVARIKAIRLFLAYASFMGFMVYQMDVTSAFLYGTIKEEVYVCQPLGFEDPDHLDKVKQKKDGIFISHDKYVAKILRMFGLTKGKSASTLIDTKKPLLNDPDGEDGHTQEEGIDYEEVFAPVASIEAIRTIKEEVYVCQPPRFEDPDYPDKVYKVVKALYGLHQAPRAWYKTLANYLLENGFHRGKIDQTLFIKKQKGDILLVQVTPKASHLYAVKRIFRYLKGKPHLVLWYPKDSPFNLVAYSDSDYAGASLDRKYTTGGCQFLDSLLPILFWAEAVNTACYVQNMVLVTKHHNKTPYEILLGRTPSIGFMRPFGCPVTILNNLDPLGKFDGKADEGFLIGYSINIKAFRVFNSKTKIVQETLHINFLENQPNVAGSGPTWLFNIDTLTQSMNYQPVAVGNQPNSSAVIQENFDAGKVGKETISTQQYVLLPLWSTSSKDPQNTDVDAVFDDKANESAVHVSP
nr:putative ribonuclease H-like domain-containing protein [Tanacetum cinerariifolium]